jgi:DNA polymerase/3'-5' exonuclease PolX
VSKTQRPLPDAERIAAARVADLAPAHARIQVAGSVRRRTEVVGDIELVAIPRYAPAGLLGDCTANLLWEHLHASDAYRFTMEDRAPCPVRPLH